MNGPLVSIAVNNYNYERFLREAIDSALAQTYPRTEVIVVDDGSSDGSREIISGYRDRIVPILKDNGGQASAFNAGFSASSGEIVIFLDADDTLAPEAAQRVVEAWRPGLAKIQYLLEVVDGESRSQGKLKPTNGTMPGGDLRETILSAGGYLASPTSGNAVSRHALESLLPMPEKEWRISADGYLANLVPFFGEVLSLHEKLGCYRIHQSNNWTMKELDLEKVRAYLVHDVQKQELLKEFGERMGFEVPEDLALRVPAHVKCRLASLMMHSDEHPFPDDYRRPLARKGIEACWRCSEFSWRKRILYSSWFAMVAFAPRSSLTPLFTMGLMPVKRPWYMRLMDGVNGSEGSA